MPRTARCTTARHAVAAGAKNPLVDPQAGAPVASGAMISTTRTPGALTVGPLRPVILKLAAPAVAMMACHFCFNLIDAIWVGRLIGPAALAAVSTAGFYVWVLLSLGETVAVGLIAVAARRHGEGLPEAAARAAGAAVLYALVAGTVVSLLGFALTDALFHLMGVPREVATLGRAYLDTWLLGGPLVFGFFAIEATFRASGDTRTPFLLLMASVILSVGLDPLLISGVGPFPTLGVEGAALASVMVRGGGFLIGIGIARRGAQGGRARLHCHLRVRPLGLRARGTKPGCAPGGARPPGGLDDGGLLSRGHDRHGSRVPHDPRDARGPVHVGCRGHRGRQPLPASDRVRADRPDVRDHSGRRARGGRLLAMTKNREHHADPVARAARRMVVGSHRVAGHLARTLGHGRGARHRDGAVLGEGPLAGDGGMTTRNAEVGTRNIRNEVGPPVPRSAFRVPTF